jgi:PRC-barrel domain
VKFWEIIADNLSNAGWSRVAFQPWIRPGKRSGLLTRIAMTARRLRVQIPGRMVWIDQTLSSKDKVMVRSLRQLYGKKLGASDGDIGHVKDFYFNDQQWVIRYVVADTGSWLSGRLVLISPDAFENLHQHGDSLVVNLTRQQIEKSPAIESHKPVSRQYEELYYPYYGGETWGGGRFSRGSSSAASYAE